MKRTLLALFVVTLLAAGTAFGVAYWLRGRAGATPHFDWTRELNLTGRQAAAIAQLETEYQQRLNDICADHCAARAELAAALSDRAKAEEWCARMCAAQSASEKLALEHIYKIRAHLTPDQQQRHAALVQQQLTDACPMRVHRR